MQHLPLLTVSDLPTPSFELCSVAVALTTETLPGLTGPLPAFTQLTSLENLTLFSNQFEGTLRLPPNTTLSILIGHSNRLSCAIDAPGTSVRPASSPLLLPGKFIPAYIIDLILLHT